MKVSERNIVSVKAVLGGRDFVAGIAAGKAAAAPLHAAAALATDPVVLDFSGLELVSASAFRESVLAVVASAAKDSRPCILANLSEVTLDEARIASAQAGVVVLFARLRALRLDRIEVFGVLDEKLATTLRLLLQLGEADAKAVADASGEPTVTTAWNNRLVALHRMGLLQERKSGKTKLYSPAVEGMTYGQ